MSCGACAARLGSLVAGVDVTRSVGQIKRHLVGRRSGGLGTFQWMAPEVLAHQRYSEKADVYSFGIVLWECSARQACARAPACLPSRMARRAPACCAEHPCSMCVSAENTRPCKANPAACEGCG